MAESASEEEYLTGSDFDKEEKLGFMLALERFSDSRYFVATCLVLMTVIAFVLGRISKIQENREPVRVISNNPLDSLYTKEETENLFSIPANEGNLEQAAAVKASTVTNTEIVVGSKNGTKYHYPWCGGAKQISDKNKVTFNSTEEARAKGYTPAANCKGLK